MGGVPLERRRVFVSHSFGSDSDDYFAETVRDVLKNHGHDVFARDALEPKMTCHGAGGDDLVSLHNSFRKAGLKVSTQERADPELLSHLVSAIADHECCVVLWSQDYASKFWTRCEWKTALAMGKPVVIIQLDQFDLPPELRLGISLGLVPCISLDTHYNVKYLLSKVDSLPHTCSLQEAAFQGIHYDRDLELTFVSVVHPQLGTIEVSQDLLPNRFIEMFLPMHRQRRSSLLEQDNEPAVNISWFEAQDICRMLSEVTSYHYRLPSEVEWEFLARAGNMSISGHPQHLSSLNFNTAKPGIRHPSNQQRNAWNIAGTSGTLQEWCLDPVWLYEYNGWINPVIPKVIGDCAYTNRAVRGSGYDTASKVWCSSPDSVSYATSFRIVRYSDKRREFSLEPERVEMNRTAVEQIRAIVDSLIDDAFHNHDQYWKILEEVRDNQDLTSEVCHFLDECIAGRQFVGVPLDLATLQGLRMEFEYHPILPPYLRKYYETAVDQTIERIDRGLTHRSVMEEFEALFATLRSNSMLKLEFGWVFRRILNTSIVKRYGHLVGSSLWERLVELVGDDRLY